jgi:hypothetical protein
MVSLTQWTSPAAALSVPITLHVDPAHPLAAAEPAPAARAKGTLRLYAMPPELFHKLFTFHVIVDYEGRVLQVRGPERCHRLAHRRLDVSFSRRHHLGVDWLRTWLFLLAP